MMIKSDQQTAKIYQFPLKNRKVAEKLRKLEAEAARYRPLHEMATEFGSGWYHDEAIKDAGKN